MLTGVSGPAGATEAGGGLGQQPPRTWRDRRGWRWAAVVAGVLLLFYCAQREAHQYGVQSDGAAMMLESWSMLHGNLLLRGWQVADVSFYTTELPEYMLVELFRGLNPDVVRICAALTYTLIVVLAAAVAYGARPADKRTAMVRAGIAVADHGRPDRRRGLRAAQRPGPHRHRRPGPARPADPRPRPAPLVGPGAGRGGARLGRWSATRWCC